MYYNVLLATGRILNKTMAPTAQMLVSGSQWVQGNDYINPEYDAATRSIKEGLSRDAALQKRYDEFDERTQAIIARGFTFDSNKFSLSPNAQLNWAALNIWRLDNTIPAEGVDISTADNLTYHLAKEDVTEFVGLAFLTTKGAIDSGNAVKDAVRAFATAAEIMNYVDPRS